MKYNTHTQTIVRRPMNENMLSFLILTTELLGRTAITIPREGKKFRHIFVIKVAKKRNACQASIVRMGRSFSI